MNFEWDEAKNQSNIRKHLISFEEAQTIFDREHLTIEDDRYHYNEERYVSLGELVLPEGSLIIAVVHNALSGANEPGLSRREKPAAENDNNTMSTSAEDRHKKLLAMRDEDIDYSDIPELDDDFWANAKVVMPKKKEQISIKIDRDVLEYFRKDGPGYQTRMNAVLRSFVEAHRGKDSSKA